MAKDGGGRVVIPAGTWHTGALRLLSHVNLVVSKGATLCFVFDTKLYPLVKTSWEELECWNYSPCIYAYQTTDIAITGEGTIDGGGSNATWWRWQRTAWILTNDVSDADKACAHNSSTSCSASACSSRACD